MVDLVFVNWLHNTYKYICTHEHTCDIFCLLYTVMFCIVLFKNCIIVLINPVGVMRQLTFNALVPYLYGMIYVVMCVILPMHPGNMKGVHLS